MKKSKDTIMETMIFLTNEHTSENVPYFIFGWNKREKPENIIDNTEIFEICKSYI